MDNNVDKQQDEFCINTMSSCNKPSIPMCRLCHQSMTGNVKYYKMNDDVESEEIRNQLADLVPEMMIDSVAKPIVCINCKSMLHLTYMFKKECLAKDRLLMERINTLNLNNLYTLEDIAFKHSLLRMSNESQNHEVDNIIVEDVIETEDTDPNILPECRIVLKRLPEFITNMHTLSVHEKVDDIIEYEIVGYLKIDEAKYNVCDKCPYTTKYQHAYKKHLKAHQNAIQFKCEECHFLSNSKLSYYNHRKKKKMCLKCDFTTKCSKTLLFHSMYAHPLNNNLQSCSNQESVT